MATEAATEAAAEDAPEVAPFTITSRATNHVQLISSNLFIPGLFGANLPQNRHRLCGCSNFKQKPSLADARRTRNEAVKQIMMDIEDLGDRTYRVKHDLQPKGKELVEVITDFLVYKRQIQPKMEELENIMSMSHDIEEWDEEITQTYEQASGEWSELNSRALATDTFIELVIKPGIDDVTDDHVYWILNYLDWCEISEHGSSICYAWIKDETNCIS